MLILTPDQINELCDYLQGTTNSLENGLRAIGIESTDALAELHPQTLNEIDEKIFWCEVCDWCVSRDEQADAEGSEICDGCAVESEEDDGNF